MNTSTKRRLQLIKLKKLLLLKKVLFGLNMFVWYAGIVSAAIGIYDFYEDDFTELIEKIDDDEIDFYGTYTYVGAYMMFATGCLVMLVGLLGAIAIIKENHVLMFVYTFWTFLVFLLYATASTWSFIKLDHLKGLISDLMRAVFRYAKAERRYGSGNAVKIIDELQIHLECCGNLGPQDYAGRIPYSCGNFVEPCNDALYNFYYRDLLKCAVSSLIFGASHLIVIALATYLGIEIRRARRIVSSRTLPVANSKRTVFL